VDPDFWHQRWQARQIGFHQSAPHPFLERWWPSLNVAKGSRVYVPLCGKSLDMVWLSVRGHRVVGSELSALAAAEFFGEQQRTDVQIERHGPFQRHRSGTIEILEGDALQLTPALLGPVQAAYDRAALVALPPSMRERYAQHFATLLPAGSPTLLVAFEYEQAIKDGPPFSVTPDEVVTLYSGTFRVEELERVDIIGESPKFAAAGFDALHEVAYALTRR
jgi:thiopurine S-methyltransferase